ncbi:Dabb family protein [Gluconobacter kondonii]|uniref:Dabb family protein n=1 Tax=Gluconobacter kondonii TaxID=941463 RepID=UPI001B8D6FD3|nr:Dabb family protein [Gluconobacter kondonii]MBS1066296.1 Dabb family protein [Gluconobacter kondonii]MBS1081008.1 Dabb family protein [Gluconobacter kondonii]MBS1081926.1 Dabb family protein [Gluconobacter kondonii]
MTVSAIFSRRAVYGATLTLCAAGLYQFPTAKADPYSLPIASSGPVKTDTVSPATLSAQQLAKQVGYAQFTAPDWRVGPVRHMVMFRYTKDSTTAQRAEVSGRFLHLAQDSRRADGKPVVASIETGFQNSGEGADAGLQQAFLVTFRSEGDRNYYVGKPVVTDVAFIDPAHEAFKEFAAPYLEKVVAFDYPVAAVVTPEGTGAKTKKVRKTR